MMASNADLLREAATLMRQRAQAATDGPWRVAKSGSLDAGDYGTVIGPGAVDCMAYCYGGSSTLDGDNLDADREHIASWQPTVALAVADWLDQASGRVSTGPGECGDDYWDAVSVARTYLGRDGG